MVPEVAAASHAAHRSGRLDDMALGLFVSDAEGGQPIVPNGLSLRKIHHASYGRGILGVRPDYVLEVRSDVLLEIDGPMLKHSIKDVHGWTLGDLLAQRYPVSR